MKKEIVNEPKEVKGFRVVQDGKEIMEALKAGETVMHWESGYSMHPIISHMEYCKIIPIDKVFEGINIKGWDYFVGKPVFCHFVYKTEQGYQDFYMVHRCTEVYERDGEVYYRIESTDGTHFGWTKDVYGVAESTGVFQDEVVLWN
jgi:hypothetical protein